MNHNKKVNYAVIGLGYFAQAAILPAFEKTNKNSRLAALFSSDPAKLKKLGAKYRVQDLFHPDQYEVALRRGGIDAVYIALPNSLHRSFAEKASRLGIHVLTEKPMAVTETDCKAMIASARKSGVKLMVAYRLHFEHVNLKAVDLIREGRIGEPRIFNSVFSMQVKEGNIRLQKKLGGGTLYDIGIYCINAARYLFQNEPTEVVAFSANNGEKRFREVDEMTSAILRFPGDKLASFTTSFGATDVSRFEVVGTRGSIILEPAYDFSENLAMQVKTKGKKRNISGSRTSQVAAEILYFSDCILNNIWPEPSGLEGMADVRIIEALYRSARTGQAITLKPVVKAILPGLNQERHVKGRKNPKLYHAHNPHP